MPNLSQFIKQRAAELGFAKCNLARAVPLVDERQRLNDWLDQGFNATMQWMEREPEKRGDPTILFPGAKSVIVLALNYYTDHKHSDNSDSGKISRYAWGDDYHDVGGEKVKVLLSDIIAAEPTTSGRICLDTAAFMDKAWAVKAGIGWLGKHSNVITREFGSWFFIGSIILDIELDYDTDLVEDHCGSCTACIDACPTSAIVEPYVVDSRKCISYATIELRDEKLPNDIAENLNGWLYGCDICQDVCPWNRFETPTTEPRFEPRNNETSLELDAIGEMQHDEYAARFRKSAIKRTKLTGLKRNASALTTE